MLWSFAFLASVLVYVEAPSSQKYSFKDGLRSFMANYCSTSEVTEYEADKERFAPDLSGQPPETCYYFNKIARYSEKRPLQEGPVYKWENDIHIFIHGAPSKANKKELVKVIVELNRLIFPIKIKLVQNKTLANAFLFFGSIAEYNESSLTEVKLMNSYFGHFHIKTYKQEIQESHIFINTQKSSNKRQNHIIREELTQSLGLINDSYDYPNSIFFQGYSEVHRFSELDEKLIKLLYQPKL